MSAARYCLFSLFTATLHIWRLSPLPAWRGHAVEAGTHLTNILPLTLYGCDCGKNFENKEQTKIFGPKKHEVTGQFVIVLHNAEIHDV